MTSKHPASHSTSLSGAERRLVRHVRPKTPNQLHEWLRLVLDVNVPRAPLIEGNDAPYDYLTHTFFEKRPPDRPRDCLVWAGRGCGKTFLGAVATMLDLVFKPGVEVCILGGSLEQSHKMHEHLRALFDRPELRDLVDGNITERRLRLRNRSVAELLAQSQTSVRGRRPQILRCDEVELFDRSVWEAAQLVTRSKRCGSVWVHGAIEALSTMHVPHGLMAELASACAKTDSPRMRLFRWNVVDALERCEPDRPCDTCELREECGGAAKAGEGHVSVDDALTLKRRCSQATWESEMLCLRPKRDDLVLPEFDPAVHIIDADPSAAANAPGVWLAGMDFGYRAPTVILWANLDEGGVLRLVDEHIQSEATLGAHIDAMRRSSWPKPTWLGVDPAGRQRNDQTGISAATALRRAGYDIRTRRTSIAEGLASLRARLQPATGGPTLFVHRRCTGLIHSLERYHYPADRPEANEPVKDGPDHAVDALRYLIVNLDRGPSARVRRYW